MSTTYAWPLTAIRADGHIIALPDVNAVRAFDRHIRRQKESWGAKHRELYYFRWPFNVADFTSFDWVVRDDLGRPVIRNAFFEVYPVPQRSWDAARNAKARACAAKGLPIPGTGCWKAGYKMNHTAKKNSGAGHRNRNRARAIDDAREYGVRNNVGNRVIPWEGS